MKSQKAVIWLFIGAVLIAVIGGAVTFAVMSFQERRLNRDLGLAQSLLDQSKFDDAAKVIDGLAERGKGTEKWYPQLLAMRLQLQKAKGDMAGAKTTAEALLDPKRGYKGNQVIDAHIVLGQAALDAGDAQGAKPHFEKILQLAGKEEYGVDSASLGLARIKMASEGATPELRTELEKLAERFPDSKIKGDIEFALGQCNMALLYSPVQNEGDQIYELQKGDSIYGIARKFKTPQEVIMRVNGITNPSRLSIGQRLKIPSFDFSIIVDKSTNTMTLLNHGRFFKRYQVRTGKVDYLTPAGDYKVNNKKKDPEWNDPKTGKRFAAGDAGNELGTRWLGFQGANLGIHGTIHPETIGTYASNGCVGMLKEDIEELFDLVPVGTPIKITGKIQQKGNAS